MTSRGRGVAAARRGRGRWQAGGSGAAPAIWRFATAGQALPDSSRTTTAAILGAAGKDTHYIGSTNWGRLRIGVPNWLLETAQTNDVTIQECWITKAGEAAGFQVKWSGSPTVTVSAGTPVVWSDDILPSDLGQSAFVRGDAYLIGHRAEVSTTGHKIPTSTDMDANTNSAVFYTPGVTTISNLQGSGALSWSATGVAAAASKQLPLLVIGLPADGIDPAVYWAAGDSIVWGDGDNAASGYRPGWFVRALFDDFTVFSNPRAGVKLAKVGTTFTCYQDADSNAQLQALMPFANVLMERFGINSIVSNSGQAGADAIIAGSKAAVWDPFRAAAVPGGRTPLVCRVALTPKTDTSNVPLIGCAQGQTIDLLDATLAALAGTASGPDVYLDNTLGVRLSATRGDADFWKWASPTTYSNDYLHPKPLGHETLAGPTRTWMQSL